MLLCGVAGIAILCPVWAQTGPQKPSFEVASVKHVKDIPRGDTWAKSTGMSRTPGMVRFEGATLLDLMAAAYGVKSYQISGPAWLGSERYDVAAKVSPEISNKLVASMLQTLIEDRFKLALRRETRDVAGYALVAPKGGPRLSKAAEVKTRGTQIGAGKLSVPSCTMSLLASLLTLIVGHPVADSTGLQGSFDVTMTWAPDEVAADAAAGPSIFTAIHEQLGLKLEAQKVPVEVLVIESAEKTPVEH